MSAKKKKPALSELTAGLKQIKAKDIMTTSVITVSEKDGLAEVADLLIKKRISGVPVATRTGTLKGIITANDLFMVMDMIKSGDVVEDGQMAVPNPTVKFAMSSEIISVTPNTDLNDIIALMKYRNVHTLPVMSSGKLKGVIGRRDIYKHFYAKVKSLHL